MKRPKLDIEILCPCRSYVVEYEEDTNNDLLENKHICFEDWELFVPYFLSEEPLTEDHIKLFHLLQLIISFVVCHVINDIIKLMNMSNLLRLHFMLRSHSNNQRELSTCKKLYVFNAYSKMYFKFH